MNLHMEKAIQFLEKKAIDSKDIMDVFEEIGKNGDRILLKYDGSRGSNPFTVVITVADSSEIHFRSDSSTFENAFESTLHPYISHKLTKS